jgi:hypothetical protein
LEVLEGRDCPSTLTVTTAADSGAGSLRAEIDAARSGDTIVFAPSLDGQTITLTSGQLEITRGLTIQGPGAGLLAISGGTNISRIFEVDGAGTNVTLTGLSLIHGNGMAFNPYLGNVAWGGHSSGTGTATDGYGGAIWNGGTLTVSGCTLAYNLADVGFNTPSGASYYGGAIYNAGTLTISNSTLTNNSAGDRYGNPGNGGGIYNAGTLTVSACTLSGNAAYGSGGGIDNADTLTVSGSTFSSNGATNGGGAVSNADKTTATITGSTVTGNFATNGGAVWNAGTLTLSGSTVSGNIATSEGGGVFNAKDGKLTVQSSTVKSNTAPLGADLYNLGWLKISSDSSVGVIGP